MKKLLISILAILAFLPGVGYAARTAAVYWELDDSGNLVPKSNVSLGDIPISGDITMTGDVDITGDMSASGQVSTGTFIFTSTGMDGNIPLSTYWLSGDGDNEGIAIDAAGNVGIGTSNASVALDVAGDITSSGTITGATLTDGTLSAASGAITGLVSATDGTASWSSNSLSGFTSISGTTLTDGTFAATAGAITGATTGVFGTSITSPILLGSTASGGDLTLKSTSHGTKGLIFLGGNEVSAYDEVNDRLGIGTTSPTVSLEVADGVNLTAETTETSEIGIGIGRVGNGFSVVDLVGDATYTDFGLRLIRFNQGANTNSDIIHRGTGSLSITSQDAGTIVFRTQDTPRLVVGSGGNIGMGVAPTLGFVHANIGTGWGQATFDGSSGGCFMMRDTDDSGWTECSYLNGSQTCTTDADGVCDGS